MNISDKPTDTKVDINQLSPKSYIIIKGAQVNNLKKLSVAIPRNKFVVITGLSGSGKSSLAFDTLYAEGQRMYVESLSSYARQFMGRMDKPEVEYIKGISPAIALEQKVSNKSARSTVGTTTEIYDYLKLLFARVGETISPISGEKVTKDTVENVLDDVLSLPLNSKLMVCAPLKVAPERELKEELQALLAKGFTRILADNFPFFIEEVLESQQQFREVERAQELEIMIDRVSVDKEENTQFRLADSVQTAFYEGHGSCIIRPVKKEKVHYSNLFERDGMTFETPSVHFFSFNNPFGACRTCEGYGNVIGIDPHLVIPDEDKSVYDDAVRPWKSETMSAYKKDLIEISEEISFPIHKPIGELSKKELDILWNGNKQFAGIHGFFKRLRSDSYKIQYRILLSRYTGKTTCVDCLGTRLRKDASYVKIGNFSLIDLVLLPINEVAQIFSKLTFSPHQKKIAHRILQEITSRLDFMINVGLGYLTLNRLSHTLSGGEYQRIKLSTSLGSALVGAMYILDEPSIGLHARDTRKLIKVLKALNRLGNTVIVVEHDDEVMKAAHQIIDIGPEAGSEGGELVFQGNFEQMLKTKIDSHTTNYLVGKEKIDIPPTRRIWRNSIQLEKVNENNLIDVSVNFPLAVFTVVTGVSGSGKSTLLNQVFYPALCQRFNKPFSRLGKYGALTGDISKINNVELINQNPIGKSSRSNPVSYIRAYDYIRQLMSKTPLAKKQGLTASYFSFNVEGGRCENCQGEGIVRVEMQFMADVILTCDECKGKKFKREILDVRYKGKNIYEILSLTVDEAVVFFEQEKNIHKRLLPLQQVGMGYVRLGQSSNTLSGGEAQRVKLASYLQQGDTKDKSEKILFIFDEPTTGLHFHDIKKLLLSLNVLVDQGHTVIVIEHNLEVVKSADWVIDLGPEAGDEGGEVTFSGSPENLCKEQHNLTGIYLKKVMGVN